MTGLSYFHPEFPQGWMAEPRHGYSIVWRINKMNRIESSRKKREGGGVVVVVRGRMCEWECKCVYGDNTKIWW